MISAETFPRIHQKFKPDQKLIVTKKIEPLASYFEPVLEVNFASSNLRAVLQPGFSSWNLGSSSFDLVPFALLCCLIAVICVSMQSL